MSDIMANIPAPPSLMVPAVSYSAPVSRLHTPPLPAPKKRTSFSQPVSPIAKKSLSPIAKKNVLSPKKSPDRAIRRLNSRVVFSKYNPRAEGRSAPCPSHSYTSMEAELKVLPNKFHNDGHKWSEAPRDVLNELRPNCPVHVYQEAKSTLKSLGGTFKRQVDNETPANPCPVHAYETPRSYLKTSGASAFGTDTQGRDAFQNTQRALAPVHAYETPRSYLKTSGASAFSTENRGRTSFQNTGRPGSRAPVHSYDTPRSSLKMTGGATFGHSARSSLPSLTRTGLITATSTPLKAPRGVRPLPPSSSQLPRIVKPVMEATSVEEGDESPRDVISLLD